MKIAVQMPSRFDENEPRAAALMDCVRASMNRVKQSGTELSLRPSSARPNHYELGTRYANDLLVLDCMRAVEQEGADGVIDYCFFDPALWPARQLLGIPVVGIAEASMHLASYVGRRFATITPDARYVPAMEDAITQYGFRSVALPHRPVRAFGVTEADAIDALASGRAKELIDIFLPAARTCISEGADTVIVGCGVLSVVLTEAAGLWDVDGVPLINTAIAAVKAAETLVSLKSAKLPFKTGRGYWGVS